jgi:hypothetical protein
MADRILVTGSRDWPGTLDDIARHLPDHCDPKVGEVVIIHGACARWRLPDGRVVTYPGPGGVQCSVDMLADFAARGLGFKVEQYPANWDRDGKAAGNIRNGRMLRESHPNRGLAFGAIWKRDPRRTSGAFKGWSLRGTGDCVQRLLRARLPVRWVASPEADAVDLRQLPPPPVAG